MLSHIHYKDTGLELCPRRVVLPVADTICLNMTVLFGHTFFSFMPCIIIDYVKK